jgi:AhpD family alkylhydroperoxidase
MVGFCARIFVALKSSFLPFSNTYKLLNVFAINQCISSRLKYDQAIEQPKPLELEEVKMVDSYKEYTRDISKHIGKLRKAEPEAMAGFSQMATAAGANGALDVKTKELIALAIGVATRCDGCIGFHTKKLVELGTPYEELTEMLAMSVYMGGGPSLMYAANTLKAFEEFSRD